MKIHLRKLREAGFSHLEVALVVVVVAVVVLAGFVVYAKQNTAHAGGWTYMGEDNATFRVNSKTTIYQQATAYACRDQVSPSKWVINAEVFTTNATSSAYGRWQIEMDDSGSLSSWSSTPTVVHGKWNAFAPATAPATVRMSGSTNPEVKTANYFSFIMYFDSTNSKPPYGPSQGIEFTKNGTDNTQIVSVRPVNMAAC